MVNIGKKIAIGGSITLTTHERPRKTPFQIKPVIQAGTPQSVKSATAVLSTTKKNSANICDG